MRGIAVSYARRTTARWSVSLSGIPIGTIRDYLMDNIGNERSAFFFLIPPEP